MNRRTFLKRAGQATAAVAVGAAGVAIKTEPQEQLYVNLCYHKRDKYSSPLFFSPAVPAVEPIRKGAILNWSDSGLAVKVRHPLEADSVEDRAGIADCDSYTIPRRNWYLNNFLEMVPAKKKAAQNRGSA